MDFIKLAKMDRVSPIVLVPRKDVTLRVCLYYRKSNVVTIQDAYPIPRTGYCIEWHGDATIFSTLDSIIENWKLDNSEEDWNSAPFTSHHGLFLVTRMHFGLKNASGMFEGAMDVPLTK